MIIRGYIPKYDLSEYKQEIVFMIMNLFDDLKTANSKERECWIYGEFMKDLTCYIELQRGESNEDIEAEKKKNV